MFLSVFQHRKPVWYPGITRLCDHHRSSSCALLPWFFMSGVQHAYPLTGFTLIWGQKHQNNNRSSPHLLTVILRSLFHSLTALHMWRVILREWVLMGWSPQPHTAFYYITSSMSSMLSMLGITIAWQTVSFLFLWLLKIFSLSLSLSVSLLLFPSSMWTLARVFIRGLPAALQRAFPGEEATGSRRMIKLGHYWASTGPQSSLHPSS